MYVQTPKLGSVVKQIKMQYNDLHFVFNLYSTEYKDKLFNVQSDQFYCLFYIHSVWIWP